MIGSIRLDGQWHFYADEERQFTGFPPEQRLFTDTMALPGTTAQARKGKGIPDGEPETGCLTERYPYKGNAWFRQIIRIPEQMRGKRMQLFLERTRITSLWVNGDYIGTQSSLCTPHLYDLSAYSNATELTLVLCVDNASYPTKGGHMTSPDTQTNWNGITGEMSLRFFDPNCIRSVRVTPDARKRELALTLRTEGTVNMLRAEVEWRNLSGTVGKTAAQVISLQRCDDGTSKAVLSLGSEAPLWDPYSPVIGKLTLRPFGSVDVTEVICGLGDFRVEGMHFSSHGRPVFLRGKHDGMIFPLEGAAPTDLESWLRVMKIAKEYGINHYRFHTCCPPDAAFTAADLLGIFMEPEIPFWGSILAPGDEGFDPAEQSYLIEEGRRILETFGNHPSFCLFSLGNELWGSPERIGKILRYYKTCEQRILMTQGCNNFQHFPQILPEDDYFVGVRLSYDRLIRGSYGSCDPPLGHVQGARPSTLHSYDKIIRPDTRTRSASTGDTKEIEIQYGTGVKKVQVEQAEDAMLIPDKPVVTHEIGQYVTYPDFDEMQKYTGVLEARNFGVFKERLERAGMGSKAKAFHECSGRLAVQCYKEELEAAMRSQYVAGFQILDLQDFSGQGTALVGMLDAFMDSKGLITPEEWRGFCSDSVLLGEFADYCLTDKLQMHVQLRHDAPEKIQGKLRYTIMRGQNPARKGLIDVDIRGQGLYDLGDIEVELPPASRVHRIEVTLELGRAKNTYRLWQFPQNEPPALQSRGGLIITHDVQEAVRELENGARVLLLPDTLREKVKGFYCADFWCYPMFRDISLSMGKEPPVGTLGLCIDKRHPSVREFRPEKWTTPPWYDLVSHADLAVLDGTEIDPMVQMIDNFDRNHKLGLLFECRVGNGRLLVCTARLGEILDRPEVRQFTKGLLEYADSPMFQPAVKLTAAEVLQRLAADDAKEETE